MKVVRWLCSDGLRRMFHGNRACGERDVAGEALERRFVCGRVSVAETAVAEFMSPSAMVSKFVYIVERREYNDDEQASEPEVTYLHEAYVNKKKAYRTAIREQVEWIEENAEHLEKKVSKIMAKKRSSPAQKLRLVQEEMDNICVNDDPTVKFNVIKFFIDDEWDSEFEDGNGDGGDDDDEGGQEEEEDGADEEEGYDEGEFGLSDESQLEEEDGEEEMADEFQLEEEDFEEEEDVDSDGVIGEEQEEGEAQVELADASNSETTQKQEGAVTYVVTISCSPEAARPVLQQLTSLAEQIDMVPDNVEPLTVADEAEPHRQGDVVSLLLPDDADVNPELLEEEEQGEQEEQDDIDEEEVNEDEEHDGDAIEAKPQSKKQKLDPSYDHPVEVL